MKIIFLFSVFAYFIINTLCVKNDDNYVELIKKLKLLEHLDLNGYKLINKYGELDDNDMVVLLKKYIESFEMLNFLPLQNLIVYIKKVIEGKNGISLLSEKLNALVELVNRVNYYFDIYKYKLHRICGNNACKIPFYLEINKDELLNLYEKVLGDKHIYIHYQNHISILEFILKKKEEGIVKLNTNISSLEIKLNEPINLISDEFACVEKRKKRYENLYLYYFFKKKLRELQLVKELLKKRIIKLKENTELVKLHDKNKKILDKSEKTSDDWKIISENIFHIEKLGDKIKFNIDSLFSDPFELEYYKLETTLSPNEFVKHGFCKGIIENVIARYNPKEVYVSGVQKTLTENDVRDLIFRRNQFTPFGYLYDPENFTIIKDKNFFNDTNMVNELLNKIEKNIIIYKNRLNSLEQNKSVKYTEYKKYENLFKTTVKQYNELKKEIYIPTDQLDKFVHNSDEFFKNEHDLSQIDNEYNANEYIYNTLQKENLYLKDYLVRYYFSNLELVYYTQLKIRIENEIKGLELKINQLEISLSGTEILDINKFNEELRSNKDLLFKKIIEFKKIVKLLDLSEIKHKLDVPIEYKRFMPLEPYHLIFIKQEVDSIANLIRNVTRLLTIEKVTLNQMSNTESDTATDISQSLSAESDTATDISQSLNAESDTAINNSQSLNTLNNDVTAKKASIVLGQQQPQQSQQSEPSQSPSESSQSQQSQPQSQQSQPQQQPQPQPQPQQQPQSQPESREQSQPESREQPKKETASIDKKPLEDAKKKIKFLEKLIDFLKTSNVCHRQILLYNSTMNDDSLRKYQIKEDETKRLKFCKSTDLLFKIQNNIPVMHSFYENEFSNLQSIQHKLFQQEILYNLYVLRDNEQIKRILNIPISVLNVSDNKVELKLNKLLGNLDNVKPKEVATDISGIDSLSLQENLKIEPNTSLSPQVQAGVLPQEQADISPQAQADISPQAQADTLPQAQADTLPQAQADILSQEQANTLSQEQASTLSQVSNLLDDRQIESIMKSISSNLTEKIESLFVKQVNTDTSAFESTVSEGEIEIQGNTEETVQSASNTNVKGDVSVQGTIKESIRLGANYKDLTKIDNLYTYFLKQNKTYSNEYFLKFVIQNSKKIKDMNEEKAQELLSEIKQLQEQLNSSYNKYNAYKLKLHRLLNKKTEILSLKNKVSNDINIKAQLKTKISSHRLRTDIHPNFAYFFNKIDENEFKIYKLLLLNADTNYRNHKETINFNTNNLVSIKKINPSLIQKEENYLFLEIFRILSKIELRNKEIINLNKSNMVLLTIALHNVFTELIIVTKNGNYTGKIFNYDTIQENLTVFIDLFPKNSDIRKKYDAENKVKEVANNTLNGTTIQSILPANASKQNVNDINVLNDSNIIDLDNIFAKLQDSSTLTNNAPRDNENTLKLSVTGESEDDDNEELIKIFSIEPKMYLVKLVTTYKNLRRDLKNVVVYLSNSLNDLLGYNLKKVKAFLNVLDNYLFEFKRNPLGSNEYIVSNPYKFLRMVQREKIYKNLKFILTLIKKDLDCIDSNIIYFNKLKNIYSKQLEQVKRAISEITLDAEHIPFLQNIQKLYETLIRKLPGSIEQLELKSHLFIHQKIEIEEKIKKISSERDVQMAIAKLKKQNEVNTNRNCENTKSCTTNNSTTENRVTENRVTDEVSVDHTNVHENKSTIKSNGNNSSIKSKENNLQAIKKNILDSYLFDDDYIKKVFESSSYSQLNNLNKMVENIKPSDTNFPENSVCIKKNNTSVCKCLLNYEKQNDKCVLAQTRSCAINNGGCDETATCKNTDNSISCTCKIGSYAIQGGVFCSSSNFLGLSFLLVILFILYNLF